MYDLSAISCAELLVRKFALRSLKLEVVPSEFFELGLRSLVLTLVDASSFYHGIKIIGELWLSPLKTKRIAMVKGTSTFCGELAPGEAGTFDLASGVVMLLLATLVAVSIG